MQNKIFRTDTKTLVGSVILGIVFVLLCQAAGLIDNLFPWGKAGMYVINGAVWSFFTLLIVLIYKQPAGIIAGLIEAFISVLYSPIWLCFIFANTLTSLLGSLIAAKFSMEKWSQIILAQFLINFIGNACLVVGLVKVFGISTQVALIESLIVASIGWVLSSILTKTIYDKVKQSGLISK